MSLAELLQIAAVALVGLALIMSAGWLIQRLTGNAGWIDAVWTFGVGAMGVAVAFTPVGEGGTFWRRAFVAALAAAWSLRLGLHIVQRTLKAGDDPRYRKTIDDWGEAAPDASSPFCRRRPSSAPCLRWRSRSPPMRMEAPCGCRTSSAWR